MTKESGIGATVTIDDSGGSGQAITNDVASFSIGTPQNLQDVTGLDKSALERLILLSDVTVQVTVPSFNDAGGASFAVFKTRTGSRTVVIAHSGNTFTAECYISDATWTRNADGSMGGTFTLQLNNGTAGAWT